MKEIFIGGFLCGMAFGLVIGQWVGKQTSGTSVLQEKGK